MGKFDSSGAKVLEPVIVRASEITPTAVTFLWRGRVPLGKLAILEGDPGLGKSTLLLDLAARVSTGREMPDGSTGIRGNVLILTAEDGAEDTVVPRLTAAGADLSHVMLLTGVRTEDGDERIVSLPSGVEALRKAIEEHESVLVILDPFVAYLDSHVDSWKDQHVRQALYPLGKLAEETGAAVIALRHLNKRVGGPAVYRGGGSIGIVGAARSALLVAKDPDNHEQQVLAVVKSNLAAPVPSLTYRIQAATNGAAHIVWTGESVHGADAVVADTHCGPADSALENAKEFLMSEVSMGPRPAKLVEEAAVCHGITLRTLRRARQALGVEARRVGGLGEEGYWELELPKAADVALRRLGPLSPPDGSSTGTAMGNATSGNGDT